jgi:lipoprotein-anchoring transpeptidase ErfK/SrfK
MATKKRKATQKSVHPLLQPPHGYLIIWIVFILFGAGVAVVATQFNGRTLPGVAVGNVAVANMDAPQLTETVKAEAARLTVTFKYDNQAITVPASELGVDVRVDETVKQAMLSRRSTNIVQNLAIWEQQQIPLVYSNDAGMLKAYIAEHFPQLHVDPQDARLVFNPATNQFDVQPGVPGRGFDIKKFESALPDLAKNPRAIELPVTTVPVEPLINDTAAVNAQKEINEKLKLAINFTQNGEVKYTPTPADIANWVHFIPDTTKGTLSLEFDKAIIEQFITNQVGGAVATLPIDRKIVIDKATGVEHVIQKGRKGYRIEEIASLAAEVVSALNGGRDITKELIVSEAPFKTVTITGSGKWIEVDLSTQTLTLYIDNTVVAQFLISSGKAATPTVIGEGRIYAKYPVQTMTGTINGEYYYVPNIKWVSYFYGGEAFHGTYWHSNFGHPMSHGCINMTEADAKVLYDFAPIGTKVIVHA